jgi:RNA polymerase-binding transcription factor DksA
MTSTGTTSGMTSDGMTSDGVTNDAFTLADLEQAEADMTAVQAAIDALEAGTYAVCKVCGHDMSSAVAADPLALSCDDHLALA